MADDNAARDRKVFAPSPQTIALRLGELTVDTPLYNFMDLPTKDAEQVYLLEADVPPAAEFGAFVANRREVVRLLCPKLAPEEVEALVPRQLLDVIAASYPPRQAEGEGAASPSPSAPSTTTSPNASTGGP